MREGPSRRNEISSECDRCCLPLVSFHARLFCDVLLHVRADMVQIVVSLDVERVAVQSISAAGGEHFRLPRVGWLVQAYRQIRSEGARERRLEGTASAIG